jgi:hypothetical protein
VVEPKQRMTADQCLDHEWLTTTPLSSEPLHKSSSSFAKFQESQRALKAKQQRMNCLIMQAFFFFFLLLFGSDFLHSLFRPIFDSVFYFP